MTLFLSYAAEDRPLAATVARGLSIAGLVIWCEALPDGLPPGLTWPRRLETALEHCDGYLVMLSERGLENWVRADLDYVIRLRARREKEGRPFNMVTLLEGGFTPRRLPGFLGAFQAITLPAGIERAGPDVYVAMAKQLRAALGAKNPPPHQETTCPFPGLEPFDEYRGRFLFGREAEIRETAERLGGPGGHGGEPPRRWLQIEGASGVGKSSLARAGLVPAVRRGWVEGGPRAWRVGLLRPGPDPIRSLAQAFVKALRRELGGAYVAPDEVMDDLWKGEGALASMLRKHTPAGHGFLLVVDQLEESFTLAGSDRSAARRFDGLLATALREKEGVLYLVTTIRSDFMGRFGELPELEYLLNAKASRYNLKTMSASGLLSAIEGPAALTGLRCAPGLPERLVNHALSTEDGLPLLAHGLRLMWNVRTGSVLAHEIYDRIGGVPGALSRSADAIIDGLGREREAWDRVKNLLLRLVRIERGAAPSARTITRGEAIEAAGGGPEAEQILTRLSGGRDPDKPDGDPAARLALIAVSETEDRVDLIHESLLRQWRTFQGWIEHRRKAIERREDLEAAAGVWEAAGSPQDDLPKGALLAYLRTTEPETERARGFIAAANALDAKREADRAAEQSERGEIDKRRAASEAHLREAVEMTERVLTDIDRELGPVPGTEPGRRILAQQATQLLDKLLQSAGDSKTALRTRMLSHTRRGDAALGQNDVPRAKREYEASLRLAQKLVENSPADGTYAFDLAVCYEKLGDVMGALGDLQRARAFYGDALDITEAIAAGAPDNTQIRRDLLVSYNKIGSIAHSAGNLVEARTFFGKALSITEALAKDDPRNPQLRRDLSVAYQMLGSVSRAQGNLAEARTYFEKDMAITRALAQADPRNAQLQRDLSISFEMLGEVAKAAGNAAEARSYFEQDLRIMRALAQADPDNGQLQRDLSMSFEMLGDMLQVTGSLNEARACFEKSLEIRKALADADPYGTQPVLDLVHSHGRLADITRMSSPASFQSHRDAAAGLLAAMEQDGRAAASGEFAELRAWIDAMG